MPGDDAPDHMIHLDALRHLPPKVAGRHTRFVLLSDTHAHTFKVPDGDVLIHAGDLTERGSIAELKRTISWLSSLPHPQKFVIAGNHDHCLDEESLSGIRGLEKEYSTALALFNTPEAKRANLKYLKDEAADIRIPGEGEKTWKVWGSPWSAAFCSMAFNIPRGKASQELYSHVPDDTDILITHGPPHGILDHLRSGQSVGCTALLERTLQIQPRMHVWGHIHEDRGVMDDHEGAEGTIFINAANAGTHRRPRVWGTEEYQPIVIDLKH